MITETVNPAQLAPATGSAPRITLPRRSHERPGAERSGRRVAVLFARRDSIYKTLPNCDVFDADRNALTFAGGMPIIAHPPCRAWGRLRHFAKPVPGEKDLALWAVDQVRQWGGVLEHPASSRLWKEKPLPKPGLRDEWGGWTLAVPQWWFGHRADKPTLLYICGVEPRDVPEMPLKLGRSECVIRLDKRRPDGTHIRKGDADYRQALGPEEREATPELFATWLLSLVRRAAGAGRGGAKASDELTTQALNENKIRRERLDDASQHDAGDSQ